MPLFEKVLQHQQGKPISFHVPGHKNGSLYEESLHPIGEWDLTEITGLDDLHSPEEVILEAQQLLADLYRTRKSYFLVNGTTVGNLAMILASCHEGDYVLVQRNCHKSILNGLMLAKVRPIFLNPVIDEHLFIPAGVDLQAVIHAFNQYPMIKACIFTYPDYYGQTYELKKIIQLAHERNIPVLIDEAHGAHFQLGEPFPESALSLGADMVVQSAHKTLPALTMGSYLHINSDRINMEKVEFYLNILQSSSPSYPIMVSLDYARHYLAQLSNEDITYTIQERDKFLKEMGEIPGIAVKESNDPLKLIIHHDHLSGFELQAFFEKVNIFPELADPFHVLLVLPLLKADMTFPFREAVQRMNGLSWKTRQARNRINENILLQDDPFTTELSLTYQEMADWSKKWIGFDQAIGKVAANMLIPYPPGIPLFLPGEKITENHIIQLKRLLASGARFQGDTEKLEDEKIAVFS